MKLPIVYILANESKSALYVGVTSNLNLLLQQHQKNLINYTANDLNVNRLVYFEIIEEMALALNREKQLKNWHRKWKEKLINDFNPCWEDLSLNMFDLAI